MPLKIPWAVFLSTLRAGVIIRDRNFVFSDDPNEPTPKHLLILSSPVLENTAFVFCLTTSQATTYKGSFIPVVKLPNPKAPENYDVIEIRKIGLCSVQDLEEKYDRDDLQIIRTLHPEELTKVIEEIAEDLTISDDFKEMMGITI
ncbi:MAG: hypothetical protein EPN93_12545 [Spirochaetes bacterium]|nr:MAG: hypothetical protein EPN93_12545 [Spirochaetota bacterium]